MLKIPLFIRSSLFILAMVTLMVVGLASWVANAAGETRTLDRNLEPVLITGTQVSLLAGAPVQHLFVYTFTSAGLSGQIPVQVDEVTAGGYTAMEDGLLDADDEIVLMAMDLGDRAADPTVLTATLPISQTWYEIEVTDPLSPTKKGWAYLVRSGELTSSFNSDYVAVLTSTQRITITAAQYQLELPAAYEGVDSLVVNGGGLDLLDRTKLRAVLESFIGSTTLTEENLANPAVVLLKDGPVRVLLQRAIQQTIGPAQINFNNTYLAYAALFQTSSEVNFDLGGLATLTSIRASVDFASVISPATFYNANTPAGVTIDGNPEAVPATPPSRWTQISHSNGHLIQVTDPAPVGGTAVNFYRDDSIPESNDTGQPGSYGDSGLLFSGNINPSFVLDNALFFLPPAGGADNFGATYENYFFNPLQSVARVPGAGGQNLFLPLILKDS